MGTSFHLYAVLDIFSRYVVDWIVAERESAELAKRLLQKCIRQCDIPKGQRTIHFDRGRVMRSQPLACQYADLGVTNSFSCPYVFDDNPFPESHFRKMTIPPRLPRPLRLPARCARPLPSLFPWYKEEHHHSRLAILTPQMVHFGQIAEVLAQRQRLQDVRYLAHPVRFVHRPPRVPSPDAKV